MEADSGSEALHHDTVRQRDREWESDRETDERENECFFFFFFNNSFLNFFLITKKKPPKQRHLAAIDNWGLTEYRIDNNWKLEDWNEKD